MPSEPIPLVKSNEIFDTRDFVFGLLPFALIHVPVFLGITGISPYFDLLGLLWGLGAFIYLLIVVPVVGFISIAIYLFTRKKRKWIAIGSLSSNFIPLISVLVIGLRWYWWK